MALAISRPKHRSLTKTTVIHLFSTSSSSDDQFNPPNSNDETTQPQSTKESLFSDLKASLRQKQQPMQNQNSSQYYPRQSSVQSPFYQTSNRPNKSDSIDEIRKNLAEFRSRSSAPPPTPGGATNSPRQPPMFQDLYRTNNLGKSDGFTGDFGSRPRISSGADSFKQIRDSLNLLKPIDGNTNQSGRGGDSKLMDGFSKTLRFKPADDRGLTHPLFRNERKLEAKDKEEMRTELMRPYNHSELGEKLRNLRPENGVKEFSLHELNERLAKLREMELKENPSEPGIEALRNTLKIIQITDQENTKAKPGLKILDSIRTPDFMLYPPKEHLVEKYFHPDNMSSAEKLKIELTKVRDEFKLSESDCGSARVQVAQLTTKIKHLSSALHKKDKHSLKGLLEMVQRRKKLLKYLRRTDWDSYCLVLDKLGLRDNPGYKSSRPEYNRKPQKSSKPKQSRLQKS